VNLAALATAKASADPVARSGASSAGRLVVASGWSAASQAGTEPPKFELAPSDNAGERNVDHKYANSQNDGPDLVPLKAVVALLWLVAGLVAFIALDRQSIDDLNNVKAAPESLAAASAP
jgi:hypothetical protein